MTTDALRLLLPSPLAPAEPAVHLAPDAGAAAEASLADEALLRQAASGDADAFQHLVVRYESRLRHFVTWYAGERDAADDVVQEIFLQAFRSAPSFRGDASVRTWLYAVARNVCRNYCRSRVQQAGEVRMDDGALERLPDTGGDPLTLLQRGEAIAAVRATLEAMPADARLVLTLRDWEHLSYSEIAKVLDIPLGTVRSRLHNARVRLGLALMERGFTR